MREAAPEAAAPRDAAAPGLSSWRWNAAAAAVFATAIAIALGDLLREDPRSHVPVGRLQPGLALEPVARADVSFEVWLVARHARTLVRESWRLFATEHCAPGERTLTLGVPMITMGLLAVPAGFSGDRSPRAALLP